jgi:flagellar biogenesis protein FliO
MGESTGLNTGSMIGVVALMLLVLAAAYYATKFLSGRSKRSLKGRRIEITECIGLSKDKQILLLKADDRFLIIGMTNQSINMLGELDGGKSADQTEGENEPPVVCGSDKDKAADKKAADKFKDILKNAFSAQDRLKKARADYKAQRQDKTAFEEGGAPDTQQKQGANPDHEQ